MLRKAGSPGDDETTISVESQAFGSRLDQPAVGVLVIAWCPHEPGRVGEVALVPPPGSTVVLGRGDADSTPRMRIFRPRPGRLEPVPALSSPGLSRNQVEVHSEEKGVTVRRVGRCPMRVNGVECEKARLNEGDTVVFRQELVLIFLRRT